MRRPASRLCTGLLESSVSELLRRAYANAYGAPFPSAACGLCVLNSTGNSDEPRRLSVWTKHSENLRPSEARCAECRKKRRQIAQVYVVVTVEVAGGARDAAPEVAQQDSQIH